MAGPSDVQVSTHLLVAAFDFGTTYSGYAFSFRDKPLNITTNQNWIAGSDKLISLKTPTCILLDPEEKFHSFGFEAENKYSTLAEDDEHHDWLFFRRFKMLLHKNKKLSRKTTVEDITGKRMFAMDVFSMAIRYLQGHLLDTLQKQVTSIEETDILYVITIPAIWDDRGKQFMRMAAVQADIDNNRLKLALEPEAASIWCQTLTADSNNDLSVPGAQYMVIDLGGGTADISVHERNDNGTLKELHKASGGPWGGIYVDKNFELWLNQLFGDNTIIRFKKENMADFFDMLREFESNKRSVGSNTPGYMICKIPSVLREISEKENGKNIEEVIRSSKFSSKVVFKRDKMRIDASVVKSWFDDPIDNVISKVNHILGEPNMERVSTVLLVGGFGESPYVQDEIKKAFIGKRLIVPDEAGLAVLKGAVRFGHQPEVISARIMKFSYGVEMYNRFKKSKHDRSSMVKLHRHSYVDNVFRVFVNAGDTIQVGHESTVTSTPINTESSIFPIFRSVNPNPKFTTEPGCEILGILEVHHLEGDTLKDKKVELTMIFGDTELTIKAKTLKTGKECRVSFDCLRD